MSRLESSGPARAEELDGRVGGDGGAPMKNRSPGVGVCDEFGVCASSDSDLCKALPRGKVNFE